MRSYALISDKICSNMVRSSEINFAVEISAIDDGVARIREHKAMKLDEIVIGHAGNEVYDELIRLGFVVGTGALVVDVLEGSNVMGKDGGIRAMMDQIVEQLTVDILHHRLYGEIETGERCRAVVDLLVVVLLGFS